MCGWRYLFYLINQYSKKALGFSRGQRLSEAEILYRTVELILKISKMFLRTTLQNLVFESHPIFLIHRQHSQQLYFFVDRWYDSLLLLNIFFLIFLCTAAFGVKHSAVKVMQKNSQNITKKICASWSRINQHLNHRTPFRKSHLHWEHDETQNGQLKNNCMKRLYAISGFIGPV